MIQQMKLNEYIESILKEQERSKSWLADKLDINSKTFLGKMKRNSITAEELLKIGEILNLNLNSLKEEFSMVEKIKVYDLKSYIENQEMEGKKYNLFNFTKGIAIINGSKGTINFDEEGVGHNLKDLKDSFKIGLTDIPEQGCLFVTPQYRASITCQEIIDNCEYKKMNLTEFIERYQYNNRMRNNFDELLKAINKIGLNSKDYYKSEIL